MFKKLRRRFVIIIMCISGTILLCLLTTHCILNCLQLINTNYQMLKNVTERDFNEDFWDSEIKDKNSDNESYFSNGIMKITAWYNNNNQLIIERKNEYHIKIEDDVLYDITNRIMLDNNPIGYLRSYNIRFYKTNLPNTGITTLSFCTCDMEQEYFSKLITVTTLSFIGGLVLLFVISIFLSKALVKPTEIAWQKQQQFVANASHELKTPLSVIMANNKILLTDKTKSIEEKEKWIRSSEVEAEQMKKLLEDMLYLAKTDIQTKNEVKVIDLSELITATTLSFDALAFEKKIEIATTIQQNVKILANEDEIKNLIVIFIDNAIKYSFNSNIIEISLQKIKNKAEFTIKNYGNTISAEDIPYIFDRFYRADKARSKTIDGYGLGLSIAKKITENYKGIIKCESSDEEGTIFTVVLPTFDD